MCGSCLMDEIRARVLGHRKESSWLDDNRFFCSVPADDEEPEVLSELERILIEEPPEDWKEWLLSNHDFDQYIMERLVSTRPDGQAAFTLIEQHCLYGLTQWRALLVQHYLESVVHLDGRDRIVAELSKYLSGLDEKGLRRHYRYVNRFRFRDFRVFVIGVSVKRRRAELEKVMGLH